MPSSRKYPDEIRERAVQMVREKMVETPRQSQNLARIEVGEQLGIKDDVLRNWGKIVLIDDGELSAPPAPTRTDRRVGEGEP